MLEEEIKCGESLTLELKRELTSRDKKVMKTFVAFVAARWFLALIMAPWI